MAAKSHLVLVCTVRGRKVRIKVPAGLYHKADARDINGRLRPANSGHRDAICIQARLAMKRNGNDPGFVNWRQLHIEVVAHINEDESLDDYQDTLSPNEAYRMQIARNLQNALDDYEAQQSEQLTLFESDETPKQTDADEVCGCVPFPVTKK